MVTFKKNTKIKVDRIVTLSNGNQISTKIMTDDQAIILLEKNILKKGWFEKLPDGYNEEKAKKTRSYKKVTDK